MSKRKLLLADDSITIQKVVNLTFADEGIEVIAVGDGDSAMAKINESLPDLILADVNMPGLSGYEICEQVKNNAETKLIPVILLVGSFEPFDEAKAERIGADDYLTKPFQSIRQLVNKVTDLLEAHSEAGETSVETAPASSETDENSDWHYADTKEMPKNELESAAFGDAAMDDEMIDAEHLGGVSQIAEPAAQEAAEEERPSSIGEAAEELSLPETALEEAEEMKADDSPDEMKETSFAIVSDDVEDEFQKEFPTLDDPEEIEYEKVEEAETDVQPEPEEVSENVEYMLSDDQDDNSGDSGAATDETDEAVYEISDAENDSEKTEENISVTDSREEADSSEITAIGEESEESGEETSELNEDLTMETVSASDEAEKETEEPSAESEESVESETKAAEIETDETAETESAIDDKGAETAENFGQSAVAEDLAETGSDTETGATADFDKTASSETSEEVAEDSAEDLEEVKKESASASKTETNLDIDDNLLELPPLQKPVAVVSSAPKVEEVKPPMRQAAAETPAAEPSTDSIIKEQIVETTGSADISPEMIEAIAQKVAEKLSDKAIKEIAWEVVPQMTELIIKKMAEEKESKK